MPALVSGITQESYASQPIRSSAGQRKQSSLRLVRRLDNGVVARGLESQQVP
jgi:hypothetical protein